MNEKRKGIWKAVILTVLFMSAQVLLKEDGSFEVIRRAETPKDYFATLDGTPEYEKMFGNK